MTTEILMDSHHSLPPSHCAIVFLISNLSFGLSAATMYHTCQYLESCRQFENNNLYFCLCSHCRWLWKGFNSLANRMDDYKLAITQFPNATQTICVCFYLFFVALRLNVTHWISEAEAKWCICRTEWASNWMNWSRWNVWHLLNAPKTGNLTYILWSRSRDESQLAANDSDNNERHTSTTCSCHFFFHFKLGYIPQNELYFHRK